MATSSLDLSGGGAPPPPPAPPAPPARPAFRLPPPVRIRGRAALLTLASPTVTLTRVQTGIGTLLIEAACSAEVGDLRLGAAYALRSGETSTVQHAFGNRWAPPSSRRPVIIAGRERYEQLSVDLRQCRELERLIVFAFSESRAPLRWGGTLITTTHSGASVELPLESLQGGDVAVLMSLYNVRGEFVLRGELHTINGSIREACRAYGFERITWLDDRTPVD